MSKSQKQTRENEQPNTRNLYIVHVAFVVLATFTYGVFIVLLTGAQDILSGTSVQTSTVLLAAMIPYLFVPLVFPFFAKRVPYFLRYLSCCIVILPAFLCLGLVNSVYLKLGAVFVACFGVGLGDVSSIGFTSYFQPSVLTWYSAGTGIGIVMAPLYYTAMTTWLCVSPKITLLTFGPLSLVVFLPCYYFIQKQITQDEQLVAYSKLESSDCRDEEEQHDEKKELKFESKETLTWREKFVVLKKILYLNGIPTFVSFFSEYIFFQSVITTIAYSSSPFPPRDHFQYYSLALIIGEVLGRSNRVILNWMNPDWLYKPRVLLLWILAGLEFLHAVLFICESYFRFLPGIGWTLFFVFTGGTIVGAAYNSTLEITRCSFEGTEREFALSMALLPINTGAFSASLLGLIVEPILRKHCILYVKYTENCFTRPRSLSSVVQSCKARM